MRLHGIAFWLGALASASVGTAATAQVLSRESFGSGCLAPNGESRTDGAPLSANGRWVVFWSWASNIVPNDANASNDVFLRDRWTRTTECVSVDPSGSPGNGESVGWNDITPDGRFVAFQSAASNLVPNDTNGDYDVFVRDRWLGTTALVSVATGGAQANAYSGEASMSDDGRFVAFGSNAANLVPGDSGVLPDIFFHDRDPDGNGVFDEGNGTTICLTVDATTGHPVNALSTGPRISASGRYVAFPSWSEAIVPGDANGMPDVFLWDRQTGGTILLSLDSNGNQADRISSLVSLSADGLHASFASRATNLAPGKTNDTWDVYARDWQTGVTELVSIGTDSNGTSFSQISGEGRYVVFDTRASLLPADTDLSWDIYLRDRQMGTTSLLTAQTDGICLEPAITPDGGFLAWEAAFGLLPGDTNGLYDVYVLDRSGVRPDFAEFCSGDGTGAECPCGNSGALGAGCAHSQGGSARLDAHGTIHPDTVVLAVHGELANALTIFLQGTSTIAAVPFGDGLRCVGGILKRLNVANAVAGSAYFPACPFPLSIPARSAQLGDPIAPGAIRHYMTYYRDPSSSFCPAPLGNTWNGSQAITLTW